MSRSYSRPPNCSLYIKNVPSKTKSEELKSIFSRYGPVSDVYIPTDYYTGKLRGFGYIQFDDPRDADDALYYANGMKYLGVPLDLEFAKSDRKTPREMRRRTRTSSPPPPLRHHRHRSSSRSRSHSRSHHRRSSSHSVSQSRSPSRRAYRKRNEKSDTDN